MRQVGLIMKTALGSDLGKRVLSALGQRDRTPHPKAKHELMWRQPDSLPEQAGEMERTDMGASRERDDRHILIEV
jgi:hypothetical protein